MPHLHTVIAHASAALAIILSTGAAFAQHTTLAANPARTATTTNQLDVGPADLSTPAWIFPDSDPAVSGPIRWAAESSPVATLALVLAISKQDNLGNPARLWAISRECGHMVWVQPLPNLTFDSWSSPTIDPNNHTVLTASGSPGSAAGIIQCRNLADGTLVWHSQLNKDIVNTTPLITTDRGPADRAFITDYEGFYTGGDGARLYCINIDPLSQANPYQPGEIVWSYALESAASGSTPAYADGTVYITASGNTSATPTGRFFAFDATATSSDHALRWQTTIGPDDGFFGGISIHNDAIFAATYDFNGGIDSSRLAKINAITGQILWTAPANRTASIPIPFLDPQDNEPILLSTGLPAFGSVPTLQVFSDLGNSATLVDDSALATWQDDGDGLLELGEYIILGGWHHQPHIIAHHPVTQGPAAYVGSISTTPGIPGYSRISLIDLTTPLGDPAAIIASFEGAGSSPAIVQQSLYTLSAAGLYAFGLPFILDINDDIATTIEDLYAWYALASPPDVDRDSQITPSDPRALQSELRRHETGDITTPTFGSGGSP